MFMLLLASFAAAGHEGEDHSKEKLPVNTPGSYFVSWAQSGKFELVAHYAPIKADETSQFTLYLSDFITNAPIEKAGIILSLVEDASASFKVTPVQPGIYLAEGVFPENRVYKFTATITTPGKADLLLLSNIEVGKELPQEMEESHGFFDLAHMIYLIGGVVVGLLLVVLFFWYRRKESKKAIYP
ncbi:MAG: hypothetical protein M3Q97_00220 [Bacteroidota bacterium]|nr:hypothetical protein [Bacteroidota bacterium]